MVGGVLGIVFGLLSADGIGRLVGAMGFRGLFSWSSVDYLGIAALLTFTFIVGIVAGYLPARSAGRLEPAEALRYE
jgi:ABC-type antimicrobial peptide transport system permease subunit